MYNQTLLQRCSFYNLTNQIKMISNRLGKALPTKKNQNNYQKPYSHLSINSLFLNSRENNGNRELSFSKDLKMKKMGINKQNCNSQNVIQGQQKVVQVKIPYSRVINSSLYDRKLSDNYNMMFDLENSLQNTGIIGNSQLLKLDDITNKIAINQPRLKVKDLMNSNVFQSQSFLIEDEEKSSDSRIYVDMKKKIKKISASKKDMISKVTGKGEKQVKRYFLMNKIYSDSQVIADGYIFRHKLISQRIDNDVDTDDQQIISGIKRLEKSLIDALEQNRIIQRENIDLKPFEEKKLQFFML